MHRVHVTTGPWAHVAYEECIDTTRKSLGFVLKEIKNTKKIILKK